MCECGRDTNGDQLVTKRCILPRVKCQVPADHEYNDTNLDPLQPVSAGIRSRLVCMVTIH